MFSRAANHADDVFGERVADVNRLNLLHHLHEVTDLADGITGDHVERRFGNRAASLLSLQAHVELAAIDVLLFGGRRVVQPMTEHEPIQLCFGQLESARLLDWVLGSDH